MNFEKWMEEVRNLGWKPGLSRVKSLLNRLENPQNKLDIIHITGTNGKGSTATLIHNILKAGGYKVGQFSSPSILGFHHMYLIDGVPIADSRLNELGEQVKCVIEDMLEEGEEHPTEYEILAAVLYLYFYQEHVSFAVVEVAMGGENDCTNVMDHVIQSIITPISLDHTDFLGSTLHEIAKEKAGIIKENSVLISHQQEAEVMTVLQASCDEKNTVMKVVHEEAEVSFRKPYQAFNYQSVEILSQLIGHHQRNNIIVAIEAVQDLKQRGYVSISTECMLDAIRLTKFEGRFEMIGDYVLDGAHNNESLKALADSLEIIGSQPRNMMIGILGDKDIGEGLEALKPYVKGVVVTEPNNPRKLDADLLKTKLEKLGFEVIKATRHYEDALNSVDSNALICGSFYLIGEMRPLVIKKVSLS